MEYDPNDELVDCEGESVELLPSNQNKESTVTENGIQTDQLQEGEEDVQTISSSFLSSGLDFQIQTNTMKDLTKKLPWKKNSSGIYVFQVKHSKDRLSKFLASAEPKIHEALQDNIEISQEIMPNQRRQKYLHHQYTLNPNLPLGELSVLDLKWTCNGRMLVASFGRQKEENITTTTGYICAWSLYRRSFDHPQSLIEVESFVRTLACHPRIPSVVAGGCHNGQIMLWDISAPDTQDPLKEKSPLKLHSSGHLEPVASMQWVRNRHRNEHLIVSLGIDGKVLVWSLRNHLESPVGIYSLDPLSDSLSEKDGGSALSFSGTTTRHSTISQRGVIYVDSTLMVGTETGRVYRCNLNASNISSGKSKTENEESAAHRAVRFRYQDIIGYVHDIECSPFHRNVFAAACSDGALHIYHMLHKERVMYLEPEDELSIGIRSLQWSPTRPLVLYAGNNKGKLIVYDLKDDMAPCIMHQAHDDGAVTAVAITDATPELLASGGEDGTVKIWEISDGLVIQEDNEEEQNLIELTEW